MERIRKVPMFGPLDSSIDCVGLFGSHTDWPVAGISWIA